MRRERSKKRSSKSRHDSSGSSSESDSYERAKDTSKQKFDSRKDESKTNGTEGSKRDDDDESVSDDSLEVVVVRKSLERKCEKVVSGRRSKTPRESSRETKFTKTHRSTRRKLKSSRSKTSDNGESTTDRMHSLDKEQAPTESTLHSEQTPRTSIDEEKRNEGNIVESRYRRDVTDSTSQETVERVVVTAMVHKDQGPDTPKSAAEASKEVTFDDRLRTEVIEMQEIAGDVSSGKAAGDLVQKAASLKKDVEEMRQQVAQEKIQQEDGSKQSREKENSKRDQEKEDVKSDREKEDTKAVDHTRKDQDDQIETSFSDGEKKKKDKRKDESEKGKTLNGIIAGLQVCQYHCY